MTAGRQKKTTGKRAEAPREHRGRNGRGSLTLISAVAALCAIHFTLAVTSVRNKSNTYDEIAHLTRGYAYRMTDDFRLGPPHPPLAHYWASLPGHPQVKFPRQLQEQEPWYESNMFAVGPQFFYYKNLGNEAIIDSLLFRGRVMIAIWSTGLALIVFFWSRWLFGVTGGLISLILFAFSPTMLAHGRLVTTDCAVALFFMASLGSIWWMLRRISPASVLLSAASLTCLFLAKMSAVLIIPVGAVLLALRLIDPRPLVLSFGRRRREISSRPARFGCYMAVMVVWIAVVWVGLWGAYGFRYEAMAHAEPGRDRFFSPNKVPPGKTVWEHQMRGLSPIYEKVVPWLREYRVFPEAYIYSAVASAQTARGRNAFLNGEVSILGFRSFFPYAFLVKTPMPLFGILILAAAVPILLRTTRAHAASPSGSHPPAQVAGRPKAGGRRDEAVSASRPGRSAVAFVYETAPLWVFFVIYWAASLSSRLNIGHRHIMPTYPVLFVFCGVTAFYWHSTMKLRRGALVTLLSLFVLASLSVYPHYLAYFNLIAGGPSQGYHHLVDSSLDWGQDLPGLRDYLKHREQSGLSSDIYLSYFGSGGQGAISHFDISARPLPRRLSEDATGDYSLAPGLYAISATNLQQVYESVEGKNLHRWTPELEALYREWKTHGEAFLAAPDTPEGRAPWTGENSRVWFNLNEKLKFARLCAYLRRQEPDHIVNHTILIYELDRQELDAALNGEIPT